MRILVIAPAGGFGTQQMGGAEKVLLRQLPYLVGRHTIRVIAAPLLMPRIEAIGVQAQEMVAVRHGRFSLHGLRQIRKEIRDFKPDVVYAHLLYGVSHALLAVLGFPGRPRLCLVLHSDLLETLQGAASLSRRIKVILHLVFLRLRSCGRGVSYIVVGVREEANMRRLRFRNISLVPNPLPVLLPAIKAHIRTGNLVNVAVVGRLEAEKGIDFVYRWLASTKLDIKLVICGAGRALPPSDPRILFLGYVENPLPVISEAHVILVLSRWENLSGTVLESLACGTPVVHSNRGELAVLHALSPDRLMFKTDPSSSEQIDTDIRRALAAPRANITQDAERVREQFDSSQVFLQLESALMGSSSE